MTAVRVNPTEGQMHVGDYYEAAWTATSSSANNTRLTNSFTLPAGTYLIWAKLPFISTSTFFAGLSFNSTGYGTGQLANQQSATWVVQLGSQTTMHLVATQSAACTFSYLERGGLYAVRLP